MAEKTYYWIKLQMDFFKSPAVKLLRKMSGGDTYTVIYLEMILMSLENGGYIYFTGIGKTFSEELALILDEEVVDVEFLLTFLKTKRLIEFATEEDDTVFKFADDVVAGLIGKETGSAKRVRAYRRRQKQIALQSNSDVTTCNTELEKELDLDSELDLENKEHSAADAEQFDWQSVIDYLNEKTGKKFKHTDSNKRLVVARHKDGGYTIDDMKQVIDNQCTAWLNNPNMNQYLRPATLFRASKFEGYLNNGPKQSKPTTREEWFGETS